MAARLSGQAGNGQILLSQRAYADLENVVVVEPVEGLVLKGLSHPVTAFNALELRRAASGDLEEVRA